MDTSLDTVSEEDAELFSRQRDEAIGGVFAIILLVLTIYGAAFALQHLVGQARPSLIYVYVPDSATTKGAHMVSTLVSFPAFVSAAATAHPGHLVDRLISFGLDRGPWVWPFFPNFIVPFF